MKIQKKIRKRNGFALVVTLMLMILLTIIAVGLLTLSSVSLRSSSQGDRLAVARANARMALMLAIGQMQKVAGPDQRVTASSSLLAPDASASIANPSWVGVWRTDDAQGTAGPGNPMVRPSNGALVDGRTLKAFDKKGRVLSWLVSGENLDPALALTPANSVEMRTGKSSVRAPLVAVKNSSSGNMAYWVSDESTKAKLNLVDPYASQQPAFGNSESYRRLLSPLAVDPSAIFPGATAPDAGEAPKLVSNRQLELSKIVAGMAGANSGETLKEKSDDFTVHSRSVLADPVLGGMKMDLTAYLEDGPQAALGSLQGIQDSDGIINRLLPNRSIAGPKFGMLRNWYGLRNSVTGSGAGLAISDQRPNLAGNITDPGSAFIKPLIQPVMAEAVYYLRHVIDTSTSPARMVELIYPRVVLWNPFNLKLKTSGHLVHFDFRLDHKLVVSWDGAAGAMSQTCELNLNFNYNYPQHLAFYLPPTEFEPGESLCFTSGGRSKITPYTAGDIDLRSNVLSPTENPASLKCFSREWPNSTLPTTFVNSGVKISYPNNSSIIWNGSSRTQGVTLHSLIGNRGAVKTSDLLSSSGPPIVRQISLDNYSRGNNGRWLVGYTPARTYNLSDASAGLQPDSLLAFGTRFRFLHETYANRVQGQSNKEPWFGSPLIYFNAGAPNIHRWPNDNAFGLSYLNSTASGVSSGAGNGPHIYAYGPVAQARQWSEWLDPEVIPHRNPSGKYLTSVFTDASFSSNTSTFPVYDLPTQANPVMSLGALQHVQLSPFAWQPTFTIGQSFPSPYLANSSRFATSSRTIQEENSLWSDKVQWLDSSNYDITGFDKLGNGSSRDVMFNDLCYEVNQALWDRYFLSAVPRTGSGAQWSGSRWKSGESLPNPRLAINESISNGGSRSELTSFHRASSSLWLDGGFNVNSTSIEAWESLLRAFRGIDVPSRSAGGGSMDGTPYAGVLIPESGPTPAVPPTDNRFWSAYRKLTDGEIRTLATEIVSQVRQRGPFLGVADFVNRRLVLPGDTTRSTQAYGGAIQAAIDRSNAINESTQSGWVMPTPANAASYTYGADYWGGPIQTPEPQNYNHYLSSLSSAPRAEGTGAAAHLNQGDILQQIGSVLVARGDTFTIRGYGEATDKQGNVTARAMCEAVVQRIPTPINPDSAAAGLNPVIATGGAIDFGREFKIESFHWLSPGEI